MYRILKILIGWGIRLYYKEIKILHKERLPQKGPLIIIANHPNTLMDAWVIGMICNQPIYYMAKATLFKSKFRLRILKSLNMIPINRQGEGRIAGVENEDSMQACYDVLSKGNTLVIFPEGTSYQERVLRQLKTGTARIALETEKQNKGQLNLKVVAVGLNYEQAEKFRSRILIDIDYPIPIRNYYEDYLQSPRETTKLLTQKFRYSLEKVLLTTESKEEELFLERLKKIINTKYDRSDKKEKGVTKQLNQLKEIKEKLDELKIVAPWVVTEIKQKIAAIDWKLEKMSLRTDFLERNFKYRLWFRQIITSLIFTLLFFPLFLYGVFHNIVQFKFTDFVIPKLSKDIEYYAPFAVFIGLFTYPLAYAGFVVVFYQFFGFPWWINILYLMSLPLTGLFAYWFMKYLQHLGSKWHYFLLMMDRKEMLEDIKLARLEIKKLFLNS